MDGKVLNEFRQDLVSGEWVLFATGRAKRSQVQKKDNDNDKDYRSPANCPFEDFKRSGNELVWFYPDEKNWQIAVIKNKFPAVVPGICGPGKTAGLFNTHDAIGTHDLFVYRDHDRHLSDFTLDEIVGLICSYKRRYKEIINTKGCIQYILIFHNFGRDAGASIYHPHSQIISMPILPPDVSRSVHGSEKFYREHKNNVYDILVQWELNSRSRIIYENDRFVALCPFASRTPYEVRIFMKKGEPHFEQLPDDFDNELADVLLLVLKKIKKALDDPSFNMFIHTAPVESIHAHDFYNWHIEILPKAKVVAGFEMGTGVDINIVDPDEAAELLRNTDV